MTTSAETIRHELARRIVNRELAPGVVLDESALAQEFGVSRTPIREALRQLSAAGLVAQSAHRKASVAKPDDEMLAALAPDSFRDSPYPSGLKWGLPDF
jgi:DNA-binding GntR family transcriptional regulator